MVLIQKKTGRRIQITSKQIVTYSIGYTVTILLYVWICIKIFDLILCNY
jgi:hypothetical protein